MSEIYQLIYEDLTHLGGPMGSEYTTESNWGFSTSIEAAKAKAEKYHKKHSPKGKDIIWEENEYSCSTELSTQDLGYVMFHIREIKIEK